MVIHEYGDSSLPKIVLLHPMLADARCARGGSRRVWKRQTGGRYTFRLFEKERIHGAGAADGSVSRRTGGNVSAGTGDISCKTAVFEGVPLYENAWVICKLMKFGFLKKHRKAVRMPLAEMKKSMTTRYGVFGDAMAENFVKMSKKSLVNVVKDCSDFPFPSLPEAVQRRIYIEVGSKDMNCKQNPTILKHYPSVHIQVREGYGHCMYLSEHYAEYGKLLESYMSRGK